MSFNGGKTLVSEPEPMNFWLSLPLSHLGSCDVTTLRRLPEVQAGIIFDEPAEEGCWESAQRSDRGKSGALPWRRDSQRKSVWCCRALELHDRTEGNSASTALAGTGR